MARDSITVWAIVPTPSPLVLVLHRVAARAAGWQPVTGRVEPGERPEETAARELGEEAGLPSPAFLADLGERPSFVGYDGETYRPRLFAARYPAATPPRLSHEHDEGRWVDPAAARAMLRWDEDRTGLDEALRVVGQASNS